MRLESGQTLAALIKSIEAMIIRMSLSILSRSDSQDSLACNSMLFTRLNIEAKSHEIKLTSLIKSRKFAQFSF